MIVSLNPTFDDAPSDERRYRTGKRNSQVLPKMATAPRIASTGDR